MWNCRYLTVLTPKMVISYSSISMYSRNKNVAKHSHSYYGYCTLIFLFYLTSYLKMLVIIQETNFLMPEWEIMCSSGSDGLHKTILVTLLLWSFYPTPFKWQLKSRVVSFWAHTSFSIIISARAHLPGFFSEVSGRAASWVTSGYGIWWAYHQRCAN